jgi:hypothetical protein
MLKIRQFKLKKQMHKTPQNFKFIADGYAAYPLASQQFALHVGNPLDFNVTQVISPSNNNAVSKSSSL